jgi:hypothetical protein
MPPIYTQDELRRRLGPPDILQIRLLMRVAPEQRVATMLSKRSIVLGTWRNRLRKSHPKLSDLELWQLIFRRLKRNG